MFLLLGVPRTPDMVLKGADGVTILHHSGKDVEPNQETDFDIMIDAFEWVSKSNSIAYY